MWPIVNDKTIRCVLTTLATILVTKIDKMCFFRFDQEENCWIWEYTDGLETHNLYMDEREEIRYQLYGLIRFR